MSEETLLEAKETERHEEIVQHAVLTFKEQWEQDRIQKRAKKKAKKALVDKGYEPGAASKLVKAASQTVLNKPQKRSAGRGR